MNLISLVLPIVIISVILYVLIKFTGSRQCTLDKCTYQSAWLGITQAVDKSSPESMQIAIIKADKLVDKAMRDLGIDGSTMGDRLKSHHEFWSNPDIIWSAHKLRNQIAHESTVDLNESMFRRSMTGFRQALRDLGVI